MPDPSHPPRSSRCLSCPPNTTNPELGKVAAASPHTIEFAHLGQAFKFGHLPSLRIDGHGMTRPNTNGPLKGSSSVKEDVERRMPTAQLSLFRAANDFGLLPSDLFEDFMPTWLPKSKDTNRTNSVSFSTNSAFGWNSQNPSILSPNGGFLREFGGPNQQHVT